GSKELPPQFTRGYGLTFGYNERKAMAMAIVDRALRAEEFGEEIKGPAQQEEFVLSHSDNVEAQGFVQHLKLPHYIDFQSELNLVRKMRADYEKGKEKDSADSLGNSRLTEDSQTVRSSPAQPIREVEASS
ncbi:MAG: carbon-phosphorus lyase complex subunit PhnI, partial [Cyanobacteria bacterium J06588_5]